MDIVITFVNGLDPVWQKNYERYTDQLVLEKRFRDWGTLRYLFRGIETNMPFIRNVHLVVSHESQVPEWVNRDEVHVVCHEDIIPAKFLPTFNSTTIEMFLHRIHDLDEEFLYFNDDMYPIDSCMSTDFFRDGKGVIGMEWHWWASGMYKKQCRNSYLLACHALGLRTKFVFFRPQHICSPMLKSDCEKIYELVEHEIDASITRVRSIINLNQYLFLDYMYLQGKIINERLSKKHFSLGLASPSKLSRFIVSPTHKLVCINDVRLSKKRYEELRSCLISAFETRFPNKSKFEG